MSYCNDYYRGFFNFKNPEFCYILGFIWADGYLEKNRVKLEIVEKDGILVRKILDKIGIHYSFYYRKAKIGNDNVGRQARYVFMFSKQLRDFLENFNYKDKSFASHQKIMESIPENNLHYWTRGYFDGDGCIFISQKNASSHLTITSTYSQDWDYFVGYFSKINISFKIKRRIVKNNSRDSSVAAYNRNTIVKFRDYIYQGEIFGLSRKRVKFYDPRF